MTTYTRIALIHLASVTLLAACAVALNVLAWSTAPDSFPDTLWNLVVTPGLRVVAGIGGVFCVLYGATSPLTLRLLRMHGHRIGSDLS